MKPWFMDAMTVVLQNKQRLVEERLLGRRDSCARRMQTGRRLTGGRLV